MNTDVKWRALVVIAAVLAIAASLWAVKHYDYMTAKLDHDDRKVTIEQRGKGGVVVTKTFYRLSPNEKEARQ